MTQCSKSITPYNLILCYAKNVKKKEDTYNINFTIIISDRICGDEGMTWRSKYVFACVENFQVSQKMSIGGNDFLCYFFFFLIIITTYLFYRVFIIITIRCDYRMICSARRGGCDAAVLLSTLLHINTVYKLQYIYKIYCIL